MKRSETWFQLLLATFVSVMVISNVIAGKLIQVGSFVLPGATLLYPISFLLSDIVGEVWGKERAYRLVLWGFYGNVVLVVASILVVNTPTPVFFENQHAYAVVLGIAARVVLASTIAYLASQFHDVWAFDYWKRLTKGKHKWMRNNFSTIVSQIIDTALFVGIAFYGTVPNVVLWQIASSQYLFKFVIAILDTPFFYWISGKIARDIETFEV
ncbi:MAG: queuosine precursor transporter [bacterium]|nr:queuosine precursor transporter [bacterium]